MAPPAEMIGRKFGRWSVISRSDVRTPEDTKWNCLCECGQLGAVAGKSLRVGNSQSCGCLALERRSKSATTHGKSKTTEYRSWVKMRERCLDPECPAYPNYGARGIGICERWLDASNFLADMGAKPSRAHSLERIDNSKGYSPENCKWADRLEQSNNRRSNRPLTVDGVTRNISQWARIYDCSSDRIEARLRYGWTVEDAVKTPKSAQFGPLRVGRRVADLKNDGPDRVGSGVV